MSTDVAVAVVGKRIRMSAFVKVDRVVHAGIWLRIDAADGDTVGFDNMDDRPIAGTSDWTRFDVVVDVPPDAVRLAYGILLIGEGHAWIDDVTFETVGTDVALTGPYKPGRAGSAVKTPASTAAPSTAVAATEPEPSRGIGRNLDFEEAAR